MGRCKNKDGRLSYKDALNIIENFMFKSGLRDFCSNVCKGACCSGCYELSISACIINEGRRLTCSAFICATLQSDLFDHQEKKLYYHVMRECIEDTFQRYCTGNIYFSIHGPKIRQTLTFPREILSFFGNEEIINKCKQKLEELTGEAYWIGRGKWKKPAFVSAKDRKGRKRYLRLKRGA